MKTLPNDIVLRPRFQIEVAGATDQLLSIFENAETPPFLVKRLEEHVFIKYNKKQHHFWSPQLHLELESINNISSRIYAVFGPNPTLWTFFMFIHFIIGTLFIITAIWAYSSASLDKSYHSQVSLMLFLTVLWFLLYFLGRIGKKKGRPQMQELYEFMMGTLTKP